LLICAKFQQRILVAAESSYSIPAAVLLSSALAIILLSNVSWLVGHLRQHRSELSGRRSEFVYQPKPSRVSRNKKHESY
jgi:hypothetical protein